jgi:hypothetical protein
LPFTKSGMESVLLAAALLAAAPTQTPVNEPVSPVALDERCFRLMADLAEDQDPRIQSLGRVAAQYFLGRIDAAEPGFDFDAALAAEAPAGAERDALLGTCGDALQAGGRDFRTIGQALAAPVRRPVA